MLSSSSSTATLCLAAAETEAEKEVRRLTLLSAGRDTAAQVPAGEWEAMTWVERLARLNAAASDGADGADGAEGAGGASAAAEGAAGAGEQATPATRVQVCPAAALAAVAAGSNAVAQGQIPAWVLEQSAETARQARHPVPANAVLQVENWLLMTRGSELRKAKSLETALRAVAHVACVWSSAADDPLHVAWLGDDSLANATVRPPPPPPSPPPWVGVFVRAHRHPRSRSPRRSRSRSRERVSPLSWRVWNREQERVFMVRERERSRERSREREREHRRELVREQEEVDLHVQGLEHYLRMFSARNTALQEELGRMAAREEERLWEREEDRWRRDFSPGWWRSGEESRFRGEFRGGGWGRR